MGTKIVQDSSLTSVANAIRTKGGTSSPLEFPSEFVTAINAIPTGTTPTGTKNISIAQNGTITENVADYANAQITTSVPQMQRSILRPDAVRVETWSYDKLWVAEEGETLPEYQTTAITLKASEALTVTHEWDLENYKYFLLFRGLVIPFYNTNEIARGRMEYSLSNSAYEFVYPEANTFRAMVDPTKVSTTRAPGWVASGGTFYRMPYFANSAGMLAVYSATSYGCWITFVAPTYSSGELGINSPNFTLRSQANVFDRPFYEALTDIRFQWIIELWREQTGSLNYDGWVADQEMNKIIECLYSANHKLL